MSRKIKFRVWAKKRKGYRELDQLVFNNQVLEEIWVFPKDDEMQQVYHPSEMVVEQYTGLTDKNGKEIYEGDILEETVIIEGDAEEYRRYRVYWEDTRLCWCVMDHTWFRDELWQTNASREVIGNVHENPELLGGEE